MYLHDPALGDLGWNDTFAAAFASHADAGLTPARVVSESRETFHLESAAGPLLGELAGRLRYAAESRLDLPAVGDWVAVRAFAGDELGIVEAVLPRATRLLRRAPGRRTEAQVVAANVDLVLAAEPLDRGVNPRRLERFLALARDGGCRAMAVLTKADAGDREAGHAAAATVAGQTPVAVVSAVTGEGVAELAAELGRGVTVALLGPSGAGKSTLINRLVGDEVLAVAAVRDSDLRGRHTTTRRQLVRCPDGGLLLDTPGLRELGLWSTAGAAAAGDSIERLAADCRFRDCRHRDEPGCAVLAAVESGELDAERLVTAGKLEREAELLAARQEGAAAMAERRRKEARLHKGYRAAQRFKRERKGR